LAKYNNNGNVVKKVMGNQSNSGSSALKKAKSITNLGRLGGGMMGRNVQDISNALSSSNI
jgi:hypothetical protein